MLNHPWPGGFQAMCWCLFAFVALRIHPPVTWSASWSPRWCVARAWEANCWSGWMTRHDNEDANEWSSRWSATTRPKGSMRSTDTSLTRASASNVASALWHFASWGISILMPCTSLFECQLCDWTTVDLIAANHPVIKCRLNSLVSKSNTPPGAWAPSGLPGGWWNHHFSSRPPLLQRDAVQKSSRATKLGTTGVGDYISGQS